MNDPLSITLPRFLDLCALCEAVVLLDRIEALQASRGYGGPFGVWLGRQGLYRTFRPSLSRADLQRLMLRLPDELAKRRKLLRKYQSLLAEVSGPQREAVSLTEMLNLTENIVKAAVSPALPASYGALLLTQPADWIRRWWRRRPLTILFRLDSKLPGLSEYQQLVAKLWSEQAANRVPDQATAAGAGRWPAPADRS